MFSLPDIRTAKDVTARIREFFQLLRHSSKATGFVFAALLTAGAAYWLVQTDQAKQVGGLIFKDDWPKVSEYTSLALFVLAGLLFTWACFLVWKVLIPTYTAARKPRRRSTDRPQRPYGIWASRRVSDPTTTTRDNRPKTVRWVALRTAPRWVASLPGTSRAKDHSSAKIGPVANLQSQLHYPGADHRPALGAVRTARKDGEALSHVAPPAIGYPTAASGDDGLMVFARQSYCWQPTGSQKQCAGRVFSFCLY
jgi:hypothetical protein